MKKLSFFLALLPLLGLVSAQNERVIDKIVAVVADKVILLSDIENQMTLLDIQGEARKAASCDMLDQIIANKLLTAQAILDSIPLSEDEVEEDLDRKVNYYIRMSGSQEKFEEYYNKTVDEIKNDFRDDIRDQLLASMMRNKILDKIEVTPTEVKDFYKAIPVDSIPYIQKEMEISLIVVKSKVSPEQRTASYEKISGIRQRILDGESFEFLASLYSEDPGSSAQGGELGDAPRGTFVPEFEAAAFKLKKNEVSEIIETDFGFHILQLIERKGEFVNIRHILIKPKITNTDLIAAKAILDSVKYKLDNKMITFLSAVKQYSDDEQSKNAGGRILNPQTGGTQLVAEQIEPALFFTVDTLKEGILSGPYFFQGQDGSQGYRLVRLDSKKDAHIASYEQDYDKVYEAAKQEKENRLVVEWLHKKARKTFINVDNMYNECTGLQSWLK